MSNHTPGPWIAVEGDMLEGEVVITTEQRRREDIVSICDMDTDYEGEIGVEQEANARLIAAAPELLESLKALWTASVGVSDEEITARLRARLAIAKATGEAVPSSKCR